MNTANGFGTQLMSIFTSKTVWKFLIKTQLSKSDPNKTRGWKVPCLMPIRVKTTIPPGKDTFYLAYHVTKPGENRVNEMEKSKGRAKSLIFCEKAF